MIVLVALVAAPIALGLSWVTFHTRGEEANAARVAEARSSISDIERTVGERLAQLDIASSFVETSYPTEPAAFERYLAGYRMATNFTDLSLAVLLAAVKPEEIPALEIQERQWTPQFTVIGPMSDGYQGYQLVLIRTPRGLDANDQTLLGLNMTTVMANIPVSSEKLEIERRWLLPTSQVLDVAKAILGEGTLANPAVRSFFSGDLLAMQRLQRPDGQPLGWFVVPVRMGDLLIDLPESSSQPRIVLLDPNDGSDQLATPLSPSNPNHGMIASATLNVLDVPMRVEMIASSPPASTTGFDVNVLVLVAAIELTLLVIGSIARRNLRRRRALLEKLDETTRQATTDFLTGVSNRIGLLRKVDAMLATHRRGPVYVMLLDVDRFKLVNDTMGHDVGDELLRALTERLSLVAKDKCVVARFGGDEFVLASDIFENDMAALDFAESVHASFDTPVIIAGAEHRVAVSIGISCADAGNAATAGELLRDADVAMYRAKRNPTARSAVFNESMRVEAIRLLEVEKELHTALRRGEIVPYFQPIFSVDGSLVAFEALARWQHPERGLMMPAQFLDVAASVGCLPELDRQLLRRACEQGAKWNFNRPENPVRMFVNLAEPVLLEPNFVEDVRDALETSGLPAHLLTLEINEDLVLGRLRTDLGELRDLASLGVQLAIDDFGRGRSSLLALAELDMVSVLKLDREFVRKIPGHPPTRTVFLAVREIAHKFGMRVVAEGVETVDEARALSELGIDCVQGYLFGRPTSMLRADELLREHRAGDQVVINLRAD